MRILLDECVDFRVCAFLRERGFDTTHVKETQWKGLSNSALFAQAGTSSDLFVSTDRDFRHPGKHRPTATLGIIYLRIVPPRAEQIIPALERLLDQIELRTLIGKHVVVRREDFVIE